MNQFNYIPIIANEQHEELKKQAAQSRMLKRAFNPDHPKVDRLYVFLEEIGKKLVSLGYSLQRRCEDQADPRIPLGEPISSGGCA
jgi:hypothetical protein